MLENELEVCLYKFLYIVYGICDSIKLSFSSCISSLIFIDSTRPRAIIPLCPFFGLLYLNCSDYVHCRQRKIVDSSFQVALINAE